MNISAQGIVISIAIGILTFIITVQPLQVASLIVAPAVLLII